MLHILSTSLPSPVQNSSAITPGAHPAFKRTFTCLQQHANAHVLHNYIQFVLFSVISMIFSSKQLSIRLLLL